MTASHLQRLATFLYETGFLKRAKRTGWWLLGIKEPESIADHSFRTAIIGYALAVMEGADPNKTAALCVFHDTQETRIGDVPSVGKPYVTAASDSAVVADQVAGVPPAVSAAIRAVVAEYESEETPESQLAHEADKIECLMQAREYQAQGHKDAEPWITSSMERLRSESARRLAEAALAVPPDAWWRNFANTYTELQQRARDNRISG